MISVRNLVTNALCWLNELTNGNFVLPLLVFYPTSRCDSRCISCDWWKRSGAGDLTLEEIGEVAGALPSLGTRSVLLSGGEPLLRREIFEIAELFRAQGVDLWLLTSGLSLERYAGQVARAFSRVTISLDAGSAALYRAIRGVDGLDEVEAGVRRLRELAPELPITARATLQQANYDAVPAIIDKARSMALDRVSFLAADASSTAFGRVEAPNADERDSVLLDPKEVTEFEWMIEEVVASHRGDFESGFIAERPGKLGQLAQYYSAMLGVGAFSPVACNAPWVSVVVEADGTVRPCYFHSPVGNVRDKPVAQIIGEDLRSFRRGLDVSSNPLCERCVCSLKVSLRSDVW